MRRKSVRKNPLTSFGNLSRGNITVSFHTMQYFLCISISSHFMNFIGLETNLQGYFFIACASGYVNIFGYLFRRTSIILRTGRMAHPAGGVLFIFRKKASTWFLWSAGSPLCSVQNECLKNDICQHCTQFGWYAYGVKIKLHSYWFCRLGWLI